RRRSEVNLASGAVAGHGRRRETGVLIDENGKGDLARLARIRRTGHGGGVARAELLLRGLCSRIVARPTAPGDTEDRKTHACKTVDTFHGQPLSFDVL